ncbi:MAG: quinolinate synthase [Rickettsiaceae bacterium]|jgi:quinolinate synthase|nr:quinolinate synthase [Rickettsiaceae bacterium]
MTRPNTLVIKNEQDIDPTLDLVKEINRLRKEMNAVILAHYYQDAEIQDLADFVGDSLDLSRKAAAANADVIVFCGVRFMADVAKILNPQKTVLLPDLEAGCSLEHSCQPAAFAEFKKKHPDHMVLSYINSSAEVKALSDIIVTSSNAEKIINQIPKSQSIIFAPDKYLGGYLSRKTGRDMVLWEGSCIVHERFSEKELVKLKTRHPKAHIIAHPECPETLLNYAHHIGSTSSLINFVKEHNGDEFIVLTEPGILHQMKTLAPNSTFYDVPGTEDGACASCNECPYMKLNTLEKLYMCMVNRSPVIEIEEALRIQAKKPLDKMLEMSK